MQVTAALSELTSDRAIASAAAPPKPTVAVIPAAGFGTRLRPLTNSLPKEMLPVGRMTALERIVEELRAAGMQKIVFVLSPAKETLIRARFGDGHAESGGEGPAFAYALQPAMRGLGDAVLCAAPLVDDGDGPFLVALGDAIFEEPETGGITRRLIDATIAAQAGVGIVVRRVERAMLGRYGVVRPAAPGTFNGSGAFAISDVVEKPSADEAPSDFAASARYLVTPEIFDVLRRTPPGRSGEIEFTDAMRSLLADGRGGVAVPLAAGEHRHDIGNLSSYFEAFVAFALADPEYGESLRRMLECRMAGDGPIVREMPTGKEVTVE